LSIKKGSLLAAADKRGGNTVDRRSNNNNVMRNMNPYPVWRKDLRRKGVSSSKETKTLDRTVE